MALELLVDAPIGVQFPKAYAKVVSGEWTAKTGKVTVTVNVYADKGKRDANAQPVSAMSVSFPLDLDQTQNIVTQAYSALKARPEFTGAKDV